MQLDPARHAWITAPQTRAVMQALGEGQARFVGGCIRNALLGEPVGDIDIATLLEPGAVMDALKAAGLKAIPTGIDHGTVTAVSGGKPFEITTLRRDIEPQGRRSRVRFTTDWAEDAARRDFRINALYADADGAVHDPVGGLADIETRRIVFIGDPRARITEDYLRILRFYRFTAWYGRALNKDGHAACIALSAGLDGLSRERVWKEWKALISAPDPSRVIEAMREGHVLKEVLPGTLDLNLLLGIIHMDKRESLPPDPLLRTAALLQADEGRMAALCESMKASNAESRRFKMLAMTPRSRAGCGEADRRASLYRLGGDGFRDQIRLSLAFGEGEASHLTSDLSAAERYQRPHLPVRGGDLLQLGVEKGPALGEMLAALEAAWIESDFSLDRAALLAQAKGLAS